MATSGPNQQPLGSSSVSAPQQPPPNPSSSDQITWDGDKMFNIYILDYCKKRGYHKTASQLVTEADIPPESKPPINAQQGLLFEWWSVFWVLFQAKNSGQGSEDAMLYHRHQAQVKLRTASVPLPGVPQPPGRYSLPNGVTGPVPPMPNTAINGMGPTGQPQSHPAPPYGHANPATQPNGLPGPHGPPGHPGQPFAGGMVGRPLGPQQRVPNGGPPYQSPTIAPSPQSQGNPQQPPAGPMAQLGRSPHMSNLSRPAMPPPNGLQHAQGSGPTGSAHPTPTIPYQQLGRPSSGLDTHSHNPMNPHRSPAMGGRMAPGQERHMENPHNALDAELNSLSPDIMGEAKLRAGLGDRDAQSLTVEEKQSIIGHAARLRQNPPQNSAVTGPPGGNVHGQMQHRGPMAQPMQAQLSMQQQRGGKRNSTSPGEEHQTLPRNEQSPPDRKRQRKATPNSAEQQQQPPQSQPQPPQQQQQQSQPQQQQPQPQQPHQAPQPPQQQQQQPPMAPIGALQSGLQPMSGAGNARGMPMPGGQGPGFGGPQMHPMSMGPMAPMHAMSPGMGHGPPLGVMNPQQMGLYSQGQYRAGMVNPPPQHKGGPGDPQSQVHMRGPAGPGAMPNRIHGQLGPPQPGQPGQPPKTIGGHMLPPGQPGMNMPPKPGIKDEGELNQQLNPPPASTPTPHLNAPPPMNPQRPPTASAPLPSPAPPPSAGPGPMTDFGFDMNDVFGNTSGDFSFDADTLGDMNLFFDPTAVHDGSSLDMK